MAKDEKTARRGVYLYIDGHEITNNVTSINAELRRIQREQEKMTIGSKEYIEATAKIKNLKGILAEHRQQISEVNKENKKGKDIVDNFNDSWSKFGNIITMGVAGLTAFGLAISKVNDAKNKLESAGASLKSLTGLDDESIAWLTEQAQSLAIKITDDGLRIRQSADEILNAFMLVGSAKPELLGDKEALEQVSIEAMRLSAASKMELKPSVDAVTQSMNQYGAAADEAARYTNVMAAGSKMGAADVENITRSVVKSGVAAAAAGIQIESLVGAIETLAEKGIKGEIAGTGLRNVFLKLEKQADDKLKPSVVGLQTALENLSKKGFDTNKFMTMFGLENYTVASALVDATEKLKGYTAAVTDTSIAVEQAAINSETAEAKLAQVKNELNNAAVALGERLAPALRVSTSSFTYIIKILPVLIDFIKEYSTAIMAAAAAIAVYYVRIKTATALTAAWKLVSAAATVANLALEGSFASANIALAAYITKMKAAIVQTRLFNAVMKLNPWGLALSALTALVIWQNKASKSIKDYTNSAKLLESANKNASKEIKEQNKHFEELKKKVKNANIALDERKKALDELKRMAPDYLGTLTKEGKLINDNAEALEKANFFMQKHIKMEKVSKELNEINEQIRTQQSLIDSHKAKGKGGLVPWDNKQLEEYVERLKKSRVDIIYEMEKIRNEQYTAKEKKQAANPTDKPIVTGETSPETESAKEKRIRAAIAAVDAKYDALAIEEKKKYLAGEFSTEQAYQQKLQDLEMQALEEKLKIAGLEPKQREQLAEKIQDIKVKILQEIKKLDLQEAMSEKEKLDKNLALNEKNLNEELALVENAYQKGILKQEQYEQLKASISIKWASKNKKLNQSFADDQVKLQEEELEKQINVIKMNAATLLLSEEDKNKKIREAQKNFYLQLLQDQTISEEKKKEVQKAYDELAIAEAEDTSNRIIDKNKEIFDSMQSLGQSMGEELAKFITDTETSLGDFAKSVVKIMFDTLEKICVGAIAERTIKNIGSLGFLGVAKAAGEIALITAAFETAKGVIGNFWTGGYTGSGSWNEPKGTVHAGEFVANRFAVGNSQIRPVLDLIDAAQRRGSVQNLTADDIAAVNNSNSGNPNITDKAMIAAIADMKSVILKLQKRLDIPLEAYTTITGEKGSERQNEVYQRMLKNKSR